MLDAMYNELIAKMKKYHPADNYDLVEKAYQLAKEAHGEQVRKSGEPYLTHPLAVASILADLELDKETIIAGLLHDVVEDTKYSIEDIEKLFSAEIALLVDGVTKLGKITYTSDREEIQAENYRKMFLAMAKDIRVILIKLADRLHNLRTLIYMPEEKQRKKAKETLDIYAPLANRLGISKIKVEMEDLALKYLNKEAYYDIEEKINRKREDREKFIADIVEKVQQGLVRAGIEANVFGRPKHFFSIYKKMVNQNKTIDQIYDLFAIRAIVDSVKDCYGVLGVIHEMFTPIPGRFKDYIAMPKPNMYQSLHSSLMGPEGEPFEIQIRTEEMHKIAEYGIAAHWKYKEGKTAQSMAKSEEQKLNWLKQILEWQKDMSDNKEFMEAIKTDLDIYRDLVYAFTPSGDVIDLPRGSTPIDFAYYIHSAVGNRMVGARVDGRIVTFDYKIKNGDRIEIITSQNSKGPSRDWLNIVESSQAKSKINQWFHKQLKEENIVKGKEMLEKYAKAKGMPYHELLENSAKKIVAQKYGFKNWDAVCAAVGHGGLKEGQVINKLYSEYEKKNKPVISTEDIIKEFNENAGKGFSKKSKSGIIVKGIEDLSVRFSKCCRPVPYDEIVGFVTRGRGISIHRTDCANIISLPGDERERLIDASWQMGKEMPANRLYSADLRVNGDNRRGLLADVSRILTDEGVPIDGLTARTGKDTSFFDITIEVHDREQMESLIKKLINVNGVYDVIRTNNG